MKNSDNLILGIVAGAAAGAVLGLMFSPHSGDVNRRIMRRKGEAIVDDISEVVTEPIHQYCDSLTDKIHLLKKDVLSTFSL